MNNIIMVAAEKRYYYDERLFQNETRQNESTETKKQKKLILSQAKKIRLIMSLFLIGSICVVMITTTAYASQVKYNIFSINKEVKTLEGDVDNLNLQIERQCNLSVVENRALNELGMVYPSTDQIVFLDNTSENTKNLASALKQEAFN